MAEWLTAFCSKFSVSFLHGHGLMALQGVLCLKVLCSLLLLLRCSCRLAVLYYSTLLQSSDHQHQAITPHSLFSGNFPIQHSPSH